MSSSTRRLVAQERPVLAVFALSALLSTGLTAQTPPPLRPGSNINSADTYAVADLTIQSQATLHLTQPVHDNRTHADTTSPQLNTPAKHFHVEAGYDASDHLVFNMYPTDPPADPTLSLTDVISKVQVLNGQATVFDSSGNPLPTALPQNPQSPSPRSPAPPSALSLLGAMPAASVLNYLVTSNPAQAARSMGGTVQATGPSTDQVNVPNHSSSAGNLTLTYQNAGSVWKLQQMTLSPALPHRQASSTVQVANLGWNQNGAGDARRARLASTAQAPPSSASLTFQAPAPSSPGTAPLQVQQSFAPGAQNVVFQHGIFSSGATWNRMTGWLNPLFEFGAEVIPSMPKSGTERLATQGTSLVNILDGSQHNDFVLIGHSQGGLISRDASQRRPDLSLGVITVDTPHTGALIDLTGRIALAQALGDGINDLFAAGGCTTPFDNPACALGDFLANFSFPMVNFALDSAIPATQDLDPVPQNTYLTNLNNNAESFTRVGIEGHASKRFVLMRLGGDAFSNPDATFGGRNIAAATTATYFAFRGCEAIALIAGDFDTAAFCGGIADVMDAIDLFWDSLTAQGDSSDGIVQGSSQHYSGATASYVIGGADSHVGAARSDKVRDRLADALDRQFFVPRAGCTFLLSPADTTFSGAGGTGSLAINTAVNTPSACSWSAVSNVPWITVPAGSHGVGSSTISYTVAPNPNTTSSRSGTVNVSGLIFTVTQTPAPDFTLAITPSSQSVGAGGGAAYSISGTALNGFNGPVALSVALSPGGPGVSLGAPSITISGSGSSSASLTLTTSTSTPQGSYAVTVTGTAGGLTHSAAVAFNVGPPPSPASGAVTLGGHIFCDPNTGGCDSGTVSIAVNNTTVTESYDGFGANGVASIQDLAAAFARDFNFSGSPVSAQASLSADGASWLVSFTTFALGPGADYAVRTSVQSVSFGNAAPPQPIDCCSPAQTLAVTPPPPFNGPAGTQDLTGFLSGGH
jgi:pimeloyl-ACP methyl ester carboxylesterase